MAFSLKYTRRDILLNRIFISVKLKAVQGSNQFLAWQLISGKTFHLPQRLKGTVSRESLQKYKSAKTHLQQGQATGSGAFS